jgi:hypothetical protein
MEIIIGDPIQLQEKYQSHIGYCGRLDDSGYIKKSNNTIHTN